LKYISIDGDDVGRKITSYYLSNNINGLRELSLAMKVATEAIADELIDLGFDIIFCAADGVVAATPSDIDFNNIFKRIDVIAPKGISFSAGVGENLKQAYIALISAKSNGKHRLHYYAEIDTGY
jgi:ankyrin repeat protein